MGKIYQNQTKLVFKVTTKIKADAGDSLRIKVIKPDQSTAEWIATITNFETGQIEYKVQTGDLSQIGDYKAWAYITDVGGDEAAGEPFEFTVYEEGK